MDLPMVVKKPVQVHEKITKQQFNQVLLWLMVVATSIGLALYIDTEVAVLKEVFWGYLLLPGIAALSIVMVVCFKFAKFYRSKNQLNAYLTTKALLDRCLRRDDAEALQTVLTEATMAAKRNHLVTNLVEHYEPLVNSHLALLQKREIRLAEKRRVLRKKEQKQGLQKVLDNEFSVLKSSSSAVIREMADNMPLIRAKRQIDSSLSFLVKRRQEMHGQWGLAYESFSWWNKFKYASGPDFSEIDRAIKELTKLQNIMEVKHQDDFDTLERHFRRANGERCDECLKQK